MASILRTAACWCLSMGALLAQAEGWRRITTAHSPGRRENGAMAYDAARRVVVWFGGFDTGNQAQDTWTYDGVDWQLRSPPTVPAPRDRHAMAYDPLRQRVLMYGGEYLSNRLSDTWEWTGSDWVQLGAGADAHPTGGMAFDPVRQQMLRFGGSGYPDPVNETRAWTGSQWQLLAVPGPLPRETTAMTTDTLRNRIVLYGGYGPLGGHGNRFDDTWEWNGSAWSSVTPVTMPPYLSAHSMTFDSERGWVLAMSGEIPQPTGPFSNRDVYAFDGSTWSLRTLAIRPFAGTVRPPCAYDASRRRTVFFVNNQTWEYTTPAAASFQAFGQGCVGSVGVPTLAATAGQLPWIGGAFVTQVSNLPVPAAIGLLGASRTVWLGIPLPLDLGGAGMPGCSLYVSADLFVALTATAGMASWSLPIPNETVLVGSMAWQQALAPDPGWNALSATTSNAGEMRFGAR